MPRAKLTDGTVEEFQSEYTTGDWKEIVAKITETSLTGSAKPFADVEFQGGSGRVFKFDEVAEILDD